MEVVLYTDDMEPITVIDLPHVLCDMLKDGQMIRVAAPIPISYAALTSHDFMEVEMKVASIWAERMRRKGRDHLFLFTRDEEIALSLKAAFLPGQRREVQDEYKRGLVEGLVAALRGM